MPMIHPVKKINLLKKVDTSGSGTPLFFFLFIFFGNNTIFWIQAKTLTAILVPWNVFFWQT